MLHNSTGVDLCCFGADVVGKDTTEEQDICALSLTPASV